MSAATPASCDGQPAARVISARELLRATSAKSANHLVMAALLIIVHTIVWTIASDVMRWPGALWDDMLEAYSWAQHWQLGYYKHPPFYAWIVGVWFKIFPRADWAFYLLSAVNVGVGFIGVWWLAGRFVKPDAQLLSVLLLTFMPYYNYMALNFNANTVLLSLWPWTSYAFVRSLEKRTIAWGALFGTFAGVCLLSKYYSILLLASCFVASLLHPEARRYYASPAPYVAVAVAALVFSPHVWWAVSNDFPTLKYALSKTGQTWSYNSYRALIAGLAGIGLNLQAAAIFVSALGRRRSALRGDAWHKMLAPERRWLLVLALGPLLLTLTLGAVGYVKVLLNFLIPVFFMAPLMLLIAFEQAITAHSVRNVIRAVVILMIGSMVVAPIAAYTTFAVQLHGTSEITPEAARDAARHWHEAFPHPLKIVAGSEKNSLAQVFYGPDHPVEFTHFDFGHAPWINVDRINREGLLTICNDDDVVCIARAQHFANADTRLIETSVGKTVFGIVGPKQGLVYIMTPPRTFLTE